MINFSISDYLEGRGFLRVDDRTFVMEDPSVKIKLIYPDPNKSCGYNTMAISSPKRMFPKKELSIPRDHSSANLLIDPFLRHVIRYDPSIKNSHELEGIVCNKIDNERGIILYIQIQGNSSASEFRVKRVAEEMASEVNEGDLVYFIYKIESRQTDTGTRNYLNIISIHKIHEG